VWLLAGVLCLFGGLCYAELGCAIQRSGGEYAIFMELLGPAVAFSYAWMSF
jgi:amino acid transporter